MGFKDGAEDVRAFRRACAEGKRDARPFAASTRRDGRGPDRERPGRQCQAIERARKGGAASRAKDDAAAAAVLAVSAGVRNPPQGTPAPALCPSWMSKHHTERGQFGYDKAR